MPIAIWPLALLCLAATADDQPPLARFGTTVVIPSGLHGLIYRLHRNTSRLPRFERMKSIGDIYTATLNVPPQDFQAGFPGITKHFEWFAIDYTGRFWIEHAGPYQFALTSDDGAKLYIDGEVAVDNDGQHPPLEKFGGLELNRGIHRIRVSYFQGPRFHVALILKVAGPGEDLHIFSTDELKPPPHPEDWPDREAH